MMKRCRKRRRTYFFHFTNRITKGSSRLLEGNSIGEVPGKLRMKIAVTSTPSWPYIRRGNRCSYELAVYLAERGHEVHYITTKPGSVRREKLQGKVHVEYNPLSGHPVLSKCKIHFVETFTLPRSEEHT